MGSDAGGERAAAFYSLVETAKLNGLDPEAYLREVFTRIAAPRRFVWNPTVRIPGRRRARWACGQAASEPVHMSTGRQPGARK